MKDAILAVPVLIFAVVAWLGTYLAIDRWVDQLTPPGAPFYEVECYRTCEAIRADPIAGTAYGCVCERGGTERFIVGRAWAP